MELQKLVTIRQRLSQLTQTESELDKPAPGLNAKAEIESIMLALDEVISEYKSDWLLTTNLDRELLRTTGQALQPPRQPGPHEVQWQEAQSPTNGIAKQGTIGNFNQFGNNNNIIG